LSNFYFTTSEGVFKLDSTASTPRKAGVVRALDGVGSTTGSSGFLQDNSAVAYRMVWGYRDENNNLILGAPSQRVIVSWSGGGSRDVSLTFTIPSSITTEYFYQIYRSQGTASATDEPSDELQLVFEGNPTSAQITARSFTVVDQTPYSLMRATLYTSPSQEGIANANDEPPFAVDMDLYKGSAFYANTKQKQRLTMALISVDLPSLGYYVDASVGTTNGSPGLTGIADTSELRIGMLVVGTGIPADTRILAITGANTINMNKNATATGTVSVEFRDRFTIAEVDYWAGSAESVANRTFFVATSGTPAQNIDATARSLISVINRSTSNTRIYGYYTSGIEDLPGQMLFEERSIGGASFYATSTAGGSFSPALPETRAITAISVANPTEVTTAVNHGLTSGDIVQIFGSNSTPSINGQRVVTVTSPNTFVLSVNVTSAGTAGFYIVNDDFVVSNADEKQNRVFISKQSQVEAVPAFSFVDVGSRNFPIDRVVALRDGIFFFKKDGIYRLSGETFSNFTVTLIDNTAALLVPESAVAFNNQVFCFTDQGICAVSDSGVQIMSVPIEKTLLELSSEQFTNFPLASFGVAYESARLYMFFTVTEEADEFATQAFVYNSLTDSWTRWVLTRTCGVVNTSVNKLFMAEADSGQVMIERKDYTNADFADKQFAVTITVVTSTTEITLSSAANVVAGMTLVQGGREAKVISKNGNNLVITPTSGLVTGAATVFQPIETAVQWAPIDCENPGILKHFTEISLFFRNAAFQSISAKFSSNISPAFSTAAVLNNATLGWGDLPWGEFPWGGEVGGKAVLRTYVPREKMRAHWLTLRLEVDEAFTGFSLQGVSLIFNEMSSRFK